MSSSESESDEESVIVTSSDSEDASSDLSDVPDDYEFKSKERKKREHDDDDESSNDDSDDDFSNTARLKKHKVEAEQKLLTKIVGTRKRGTSLRAKPKKRNNREEIIHVHEIASTTYIVPFDTTPYFPQTVNATKNYRDSLQRLQELTIIELMQRFCLFRVQCALHDGYYTEVKSRMDSIDFSPDMSDDVTLHSCFSLRAQNMLANIMTSLRRKNASIVQRNFLNVMKNNLISSYKISICKDFIPNMACAISSEAPQKTSGRRVDFDNIVLPSIEELYQDKVSDRLKPFYDVNADIYTEFDEVSRRSMKCVHTTSGSLYIDSAYQNIFMGIFVILRFPIIVSGDALRLIKASPKHVIRDGVSMNTILSTFLTERPNWWAHWMTTYDIGMKALLDFAGVKDMTPLNVFIKEQLVDLMKSK